MFSGHPYTYGLHYHKPIINTPENMLYPLVVVVVVVVVVVLVVVTKNKHTCT